MGVWNFNDFYGTSRFYNGCWLVFKGLLHQSLESQRSHCGDRLWLGLGESGWNAAGHKACPTRWIPEAVSSLYTAVSVLTLSVHHTPGVPVLYHSLCLRNVLSNGPPRGSQSEAECLWEELEGAWGGTFGQRTLYMTSSKNKWFLKRKKEAEW